MPYLNIKGAAGNPVERIFWGVIPIVRASSMIAYRPGYGVEHLIYSFKYRHRSDLAVELGRMMACELKASGFFDGIDYLQPVPLHPHRQRSRGYNQSERLAQGIAEITGLPIGDFVRRKVDNVSQTRFSHFERNSNVQDIFEVNTEEVTRRQPQHILFVDDVITTGSTIINCVQSLTGIPGIGVRPPVYVSVLSLAYAGQMHLGRLTEAELGQSSRIVDNSNFRERQVRPL